jgi:hypothetical protein
MLRIGIIIRSAKINATTLPKLIPPFHCTAARGIFSIEQTKENISITGPTIAPHNFDNIG